jgi:hypothetical protein
VVLLLGGGDQHQRGPDPRPHLAGGASSRCTSLTPIPACRSPGRDWSLRTYANELGHPQRFHGPDPERHEGGPVAGRSLGTAHRWHQRLARLGEQVSGVLPALVGVEGDAGDIPTTDRDRHRQHGVATLASWRASMANPTTCLECRSFTLATQKSRLSRSGALRAAPAGCVPTPAPGPGPLISGWA